jgi:UDP-glucuronate 4-epimerase
MRILLTGAAGFIGSHVAERLCARGDDVVGFDNFDTFYPRRAKEQNLAGVRKSLRFSLVEGDLTQSGDLERAFTAARRVDLVVHLAALAGVRPSLRQPARYADVNVAGTVRLFEECRRAEVDKVVFASSSSVYGGDSKPPFREDDPCVKPLSPYAATKRAGELLALSEHHVHGTSITSLRFFTVYGPRQRPDLAIHKFTRAIALGKSIELFGDGTSSRDYTWIDDIVDGVIAAIDQQARQGEARLRTYNLGGCRTTTLNELVDHIAAALGREAVIVRKPDQVGDMKHTWADTSRAEADLGYRPQVALPEGIPRFVRWWCEAHEEELKAAGVRIATLPYGTPPPPRPRFEDRVADHEKVRGS